MKKITSQSKLKNNVFSSSSNCMGFTLVELMIVVAIIGILSAIATPIYKNYVGSARKAKAEAELMQLPILLEQYRAESLAGDLCPNQPAGGCDAHADNPFTEDEATGIFKISNFLPAFTATPSPTSGKNYKYQINFTSNTDAILTLETRDSTSNAILNTYTCFFPKGNCN